MAWSDVDANIRFSRADDRTAIADDWTIGTCRMGASPADIVDDLIESRRARSTDAIIY